MTEADSGRLAELYRQHAAEAIRLAYLLTGDRNQAEDLVQDAFVKLAGHLVHLRDPGAFDAYLRRTIVNSANSSFRRKRIERAYLKRAAAEPTRPGDPADVDRRAELWTDLQRLPTRQRTAIVLRIYEDSVRATNRGDPGLPPGNRPIPRLPRARRDAHPPQERRR